MNSKPYQRLLMLIQIINAKGLARDIALWRGVEAKA